MSMFNSRSSVKLEQKEQGRKHELERLQDRLATLKAQSLNTNSGQLLSCLKQIKCLLCSGKHKNYQLAIHYIEDAKNIAEFINNKKQLKDFAFDLANVYHLTGQYDEALLQLQLMQNAQILQQKYESETMFQILFRKAGVYMQKKNWSKALYNYHQSLKMGNFLELQLSTNQAISHENIGKCYMHYKNQQKAITFYTQAIRLWKQLSYPGHALRCQYELARAYFQFGMLDECCGLLYRSFAVGRYCRELDVEEKKAEVEGWVSVIAGREGLKKSTYNCALKTVEKFWAADQMEEQKELLRFYGRYQPKQSQDGEVHSQQ